MDWISLIPPILDFLGSIFSTSTICVTSCAWPISILILALLLRRPIMKVIPSITKLKAGNFEFEFSRRIEELEQEAERVELPDIDEFDFSIFGKQASSIFRLADINPRSAILESWLMVETAISEVAIQYGFDEQSNVYRSTTYLLKKLTDEDVLSKDIRNIVNRLRHLRNQAVHEIDFDISSDQIYDYINLSLRVVRLLRNEFENN